MFSDTTSPTQHLAAFSDVWNGFWQGSFGNWLATKGLHILLVHDHVVRVGTGRQYSAGPTRGVVELDRERRSANLSQSCGPGECVDFPLRAFQPGVGARVGARCLIN